MAVCGAALIITGCAVAVGPTLAIRAIDDQISRARHAEVLRWLALDAQRSARSGANVIVPGTSGYLLEIPKIGVQVVVHVLEPAVLDGVNTPTLRRYGVGQVPYIPGLGNVDPGAEGTVAITGHRTTSGAPFRRLDELRPGDAIVIRKSGAEQRWAVVSSAVIPPRNVDAIRSAPGVRRLILLACTPPFSARARVLVYAKLQPETASYVPTRGVATDPQDPHVAGSRR